MLGRFTEHRLRVAKAHQIKAKPHTKSVAKFKARMKQLTCRSWGVSNAYKVQKLNELILPMGCDKKCITSVTYSATASETMENHLYFNVEKHKYKYRKEKKHEKEKTREFILE